MSSPPEHAATVSAAAEARGSLRLTRSISATWTFTATSILIFELLMVFFTVAVLVDGGSGGAAAAGVGAAGLLWTAATLLPLLDYRHRTDAAPIMSVRHLAPLLMAAIYGLAAGMGTGIWVLAAVPVIQIIMLLNWPPGVRLRVVLAATGLLVAVAAIDFRLTLADSSGTVWPQAILVGVALPAITVSSLWWWDVLVTLDRARGSEARLAATQERLRLATDVHDLQGHHLQVIALQLELAERLMPHDPETGMEHLRAARASVAGASQGTRDLAARFRSVPLRDEMANAVDLLRAGGHQAEFTTDPDTSLAPASVLGPVIRETTTNVLRHGGGRWAQLSLSRADEGWRYQISNDVGAVVSCGDASDRDASGLDGIALRAAGAGGELEVRREDETFTVVVTVPAPGKDSK
ncbi:sensor histidine kinase [Arthrobacter jiangjiafuii]|uniref:histidine kinase n=1 Tax=Arthrobacter jiangjiafuii TaxID=2817475 RepID=A0A975M6H9_9MICC|nr:histidine kinase [Arthrobacter jiangjiafuii]MBP3044830.1 sensor histidine kinase [Arthrobacter jiangjiafuii]QWC10346.1 sensor histidine kinase [Arthrobacter jiangjiafuii]